MLEMCLTSNVKGRTVASYSEHHFSYWYKEGHPVVVCVSLSILDIMLLLEVTSPTRLMIKVFSLPTCQMNMPY